MTDATLLRASVHYSGRVQGVGFRFTAQSIARRYAVTGVVRNLPDGRVYLVAEGDKREVERFLAEIAQSMQGNIDSAASTLLPATGEFATFAIQA